MQVEHQAFQLQMTSWERNPLEHLEVVPFDGYSKAMEFRPSRRQYPQYVDFLGRSLDSLELTDFPNADMTLVSQRMATALQSVGRLGAQMVPVRIYRDGEPDVDPVNSFVLLHFVEQLSCLDYENSIWSKERCTRDIIRPIIREVALRTPPAGFPPIFRLAQAPTLLFVSGAGRRAMEAAGVRGVDFIELEVGAGANDGTESLSAHDGEIRPVSAAELGSIRLVIPRGIATGFHILRYCVNAEVLSLRGCEVRDLSFWPPAPRATLADLRFTPVSCIDILTRTPGLRDVLIDATMVRSLESLRSLNRLRFVSVRGCPLSEQSYRETIPELRSAGVHVECTNEEEWKLTCELIDRGLDAVFMSPNPGPRRPSIAVMGMQFIDRLPTNLLPVGIDIVRRVLAQENLTTAALLAQCEELTQ